MPILCDNMMNSVLDFIPNDTSYLNNFQLSCKLFKSIIQPRLDEIYWRTLEKILGKKNCEGLKNNTLKNFYWSIAAEDYCGKKILYLFDALKKNTSIVSIDFDPGDNSLSLEVAEKLGELLKTNTTITSLKFSYHWYSFCDTYISEALKVNKTLKTLCFWGTEIYDAEAMSDMLKVNTTLEELEISEQEYDSWHWYLLAPGLKANKTLKTLKLWSVWFDEDGLSDITEVIKHNTSITYLDLSSNYNIDDDLIKYIADMIRGNSTLKELYLRSIKITDKGAMCLHDALIENNTLETISFCSIDEECDIDRYSSETLRRLNELSQKKPHLTINTFGV